MADFTTSSFSLNSSQADYSVLAGFALTSSNVQTASYSISSSYADRAGIANTASFTVSSSYSDYSTYSGTSSITQSSSFAYISNFAYLANNANTASYASSSFWADSSSQAISSSYASSSFWATSASQAISSSYASSSFWATSASRAISASYADYAVTSSSEIMLYDGIFLAITPNFIRQINVYWPSGNSDNLFFVGNNYYQSIGSIDVSNNVAYLRDVGSTTYSYSVVNFDPNHLPVSVATSNDVYSNIRGFLIQYISSGVKYVWLSSSTSPIPSGTTQLKSWSYNQMWFYGRYYTGTQNFNFGSYSLNISNVTCDTLFDISGGKLTSGFLFYFNDSPSQTTQQFVITPYGFINTLPPTNLSYKYWILAYNLYTNKYLFDISCTNFTGKTNPSNNSSILNNFYLDGTGVSQTPEIIRNLYYYYTDTVGGNRGVYTKISGLFL